MPIALAVHGGAWNMPDDFVDPATEGVREALSAGWETLTGGGSALDAVEGVIRILEDNPIFDAGRGSRLNREGKVEMDASIMEGEGLNAGAVAAIQRVRHPISVARMVMERSSHVMFVGQGAREFAEECGAELCRTQDLLVGRERERFLRVRAGESGLVDDEFGPPPARPLGTVGAVALDSSGRMAAGTSTGGTQDKAPGRVGDTPIVGAGTYVDQRRGAASATGWGEAILRVVLTKTAVDGMGAGLKPHAAGERALRELERIGGLGGLILLDRHGRVGSVFNTPRMARGWVTEGVEPQVSVNRGDDST